MPKRTDIKKILVIGSGPIVIGQAAEFDYAGTQGCLALREEGYEVVLCNSNPATIMTDSTIADKVYMEPLNVEYLAKIIRRERPDALLAGLGGQTGLNLTMELVNEGVLKECGCILLGTKKSSIELSEDRELFKNMCEEIGEPVIRSEIVRNMEEGRKAAADIGFPLVIRPAFTLGGTGGGFAGNEEEYEEILKNALSLSPVSEALIEKSVKGFKEIEYEVIRDSADNAIVVCNMENVDPVGIHTGDSVVVCPSLTLTNRDYQMLRDSALKIIRRLRIEGGCNVQFALDPVSREYFVIEVNPRVSRSSALASKASGYPIARVSAKIAVGLTLPEIPLANTPACFEPALDYVVTKMPRFPFDKFKDANPALNTQMKATGEVMAVGRTFEESFLKAIRSLETGHDYLYDAKFDDNTNEEILDFIKDGTDTRIYAIAELLRRGVTDEEIVSVTGMDKFFIHKLRAITDEEEVLKNKKGDRIALLKAKRMGFPDTEIAKLWGEPLSYVEKLRKETGVQPVFKMIDSCASEFKSYIPYFYSTYERENEAIVEGRKKIVVLGSGPIRIGQGVEFDYSTVHAVKTIKSLGYEAIIINNNPETVSTDYTTADKLYFEPLCTENVMNIIDMEKPDGVIVSLGGQTAINLAQSLHDRGVKLVGTGVEAIDRAEDRDLFEKVLDDLSIPKPEGYVSSSIEEGLKIAEKIGYPVLVRPSFVLGGRAMQIVSKPSEMEHYLKNAAEVDEERPVLVDKYIKGKELEVDAICDGSSVFVPGIMELVEKTGVHSGDSISVYPPFTVSEKVKETILDYTKRLGLGIGIVGLFNIQFIVDEKENVYIIEVNPRSSRSVPFISKATGISLPDIATKVMLGHSLSEQGITENMPRSDRFYVKVPAFSFLKLRGMDSYLSPEMKSTGEAIGYDEKLHRAMYKALTASGVAIRTHGTVIVSLADEDKIEAMPLIKRFYDLGFNIEATSLTGKYLADYGIRNRVRKKLSEGSTEILEAIKSGGVSYVINTRAILSGVHYEDGAAIRRCATENNVTMFTSLDTLRVVLDVLEEQDMGVSTIDA
ncbi:MAG: carbamoyl-phosphate synthase large subunit [Lachnospiraceae bacterium]|nr:carbamoyl-phosphate synthase large subunit [Lachnospiraceae bacterium]